MINGVNYTNQIVNLPRLITSSKFFETYYSGKWKQTDLTIDLPNAQIKPEHITTILGWMQGNNVSITGDFYTYKCLLDYFQVDSDLLGKLEFVIEAAIHDKSISNVQTFLCRPGTTDLLNSTELMEILQVTDPNDFDQVRRTIELVTHDLIDLYLIYDWVRFCSAKQNEHHLKILEPMSSHGYHSGDLILPTIDVFTKKFEFLTDGLLDQMEWDHVAMCGDCIALLINDSLDIAKYPYLNINLFVWGDSLEHRIRTTSKILSLFTKNYGKDNVFCFRKNDTRIVLVRNKKRTIQIIDSGKKSLIKILWNFDMATAKIAYNGSSLVATNDFFLAVTKQQLIVASPVAEISDIVKYLLFGYEIVLNRVKQIDDTGTKYPTDTFLANCQWAIHVFKVTDKYLHITKKDSIDRIIYLFQKVYGPDYHKINHIRQTNCVSPEEKTTMVCVDKENEVNFGCRRLNTFVHKYKILKILSGSHEKIFSIKNVIILDQYILPKSRACFSQFRIRTGVIYCYPNDEQFGVIKNAMIKFVKYYQSPHATREQKCYLDYFSKGIKKVIDAHNNRYCESFRLPMKNDTFKYNFCKYGGQFVDSPEKLQRLLSDISDSDERDHYFWKRHDIKSIISNQNKHSFWRKANIKFVIRFRSDGQYRLSECHVYDFKLVSMKLKEKIYELPEYLKLGDIKGTKKIEKKFV